MIFNEYYNAMDRGYGEIEPSDIPPEPGMPIETSNLGPAEIGTGTNPMANQLQAFNAKIREGAGKIEFEFLGAGKSNSQQPSPEAFGTKERADMRALAEINEIKTSVHAPIHTQSLAGLGEQGFNDQARQAAVKEIERAIHFAAEATKGGAVVFHTSEWGRPLTEIKEKTGEQLFEGYKEEAERALVMVADSRTGNVNAVRKDYYVYEPKFHTAKTYEEVIGRKLVGTVDSKTGLKIEANDWVDMNGHPIKREWILEPEKSEELFNRVPVWNKEATRFEVERVEYKDFEKEAQKLSNELGQNIAPEVLFFKMHIANNVLRAKGQSLFSAQRYERAKERRDAAQKALTFYESLEKNIPEDEKWKIIAEKRFGEFIPPKHELPSEYLKGIIKEEGNEMRYIHESSASADAEAKRYWEEMNRVQTIEQFGKGKVAETIAQAGIKAMIYTDQHRKELNEPIFVAPENWRPEHYGSHPDEIKAIVEESRKKMQEQLVKEGHSEEEAKSKAKEHIKATLDIGHFNMWRQHFKKLDGETPDARNKRFDKWLLKETEKLAKGGILGHVHLTDNFGYDDEHLTPGQGNVPMKEFIKKMEEAGLKDFIAEAGSYNTTTALPDTWALMGSPIYATTGVPSFRSVHEQHFGYHNPSTYIVGAYAPSNEWRLWSEVPLE
ncbi:MAG TPA: TIM barrel protein [Candidatus Nanoarchaeia archaeon]|nr:TIM barrel protein [Candidatus Nanoarchaeia archaeon]